MKTFTDYLVGTGDAQNNRLINKSDGSVVAVVNGWNGPIRIPSK